MNQPLPQIALERDGSNALLRRYIYGTRRISMTSGSNTSYYIYDGLGSAANLTSSSGATQWTWSYEPFGTIRTETKASGNQPDNLMKFTGEYLDPTGLYHLRARQYDPVSGRLLAPDPLGSSLEQDHAPSASSYAYAGNRPTVMVDASGETFVPSDDFPRAVLEAASLGSRFGINCRLPLSGKTLTNARIIFWLARDAGLSAARAREMVAAACQESSLIASTPSPGKGLFQLVSAGFINRANSMKGGVLNPRANTCAILPDYLYYWRRHPNARPGACAACVEYSGSSAAFYAAPLERLPRTFARIAVRPCPRLPHLATRTCY